MWEEFDIWCGFHKVGNLLHLFRGGQLFHGFGNWDVHDAASVVFLPTGPDSDLSLQCEFHRR